ncbi:MAG TPA: GAF domain-containing protein [Verrucomicrobiae bacterium]|nr:GAF domain-containing protein [Verrucomicrobiae bacterium]
MVSTFQQQGDNGAGTFDPQGLELERCRRELEVCRERMEQMEGLFAHVVDAIFVSEIDGAIIDANPAACASLGYSKAELLTMHPWDFVTSASREEILGLIQGMKCGAPLTLERTYRGKNGGQKIMEVQLTRCMLGGRDLVIVAARDFTRRKWAEALLAGEKRLLEMAAKGESLGLILDTICRVVEDVSSGSICSILLLDATGERLWHGAAPSLPGSYIDAINGREICLNLGPCAKAAFSREAVIVSDVAKLPPGAEYRELALAHGLQACWSSPILSSDEKVLGTFAIYSRKPGSPTAQQYQVIERISHLAAVAIERKRAEDALRRSEAYLAEAQKLSLTGSFGWNVSTGEIVWSSETYRIMGLERTAKPTLDLVLQRVHPDDAERVRQTLEGSTRDRRNLDFEHRLIMANGSVKHVHVVAHAGADEANGLEFVGAVMDVTCQKKIEEALRASERLARGQLETLTRTLDVISTESALDKLVEHVLRTVAKQLGAHSSSVWLKDESREMMVFEFALEAGKLKTKNDAALAAISPTSPADAFWPWPEVNRTGRPYVIEDVREGPDIPWRDHLLAQGIITILVVPLLVAGKVAGVMGIRFTHKRIFRPEEMELSQALSNQAMLAIQLLRLSARSREAAVVAERNRMARDIHDTLAQGFTGIIVQLEAAEDAMSQGLEEETAEHLDQAGEVARQSLREARRSVLALRPQALEDKNLCDALDDLVRKMTAGTSLRAEFILQGQSRPRPAGWDENLLRVGQEVLTNALRHAGATEFQVRLVFAEREIRMEFCDNGRGFDPTRKHDGFGLLGMRERVAAMGGELTIESANGQGTSITATLPMTETSAIVPE